MSSATRAVLAATLACAAVLALTSSAHADPAPLCDTDASCAALGIGTGYGVTEELIAQAAAIPTLGVLTLDPNGVVIHPQPGGELIVWPDHSQFVPMPAGWVSVYQGQPGEDPTVIEPPSNN